MAQLLKHYLVDRDDPSVFATTQEQFNRPLFGTMNPNIEGLEVVHILMDNNEIQFFLSTCPDTTTINEVEGLKVITQEEWDIEIAEYDERQQSKRWKFIRKYRDQVLSQTDWIVIKSLETNSTPSSDFISWRQSLRDLTSSKIVPLELPAPPVGVLVDEEIYAAYVSALRSIPMINDPLPALV